MSVESPHLDIGKIEGAVPQGQVFSATRQTHEALFQRLHGYEMPNVPDGDRGVAVMLVTRYQERLLQAATPDELSIAARMIDEDWRQRVIHANDSDDDYDD